MFQLSLQSDKHKRINTQSSLFEGLMKQSILFYQLFIVCGFRYDHGVLISTNDTKVRSIISLLQPLVFVSSLHFIDS